LFKGYGAKVGLGNMRVKAENRMVTQVSHVRPLYPVASGDLIKPRIVLSNFSLYN
jgi:hypothetical protein